MSGTGAGRGSGRAHFRSKSGCCICGTKSSSSRFTASERYAEHFGNCFGEAATNRSGDLCNACVLCVKRWLSRGKEAGRFKQVLDSKRGPGPKHMKEIAKRARRREAKKQQLQEIIQIQKHSIHNHQSFSSTRVSSRVAASFSKNSNINSSSSPSPSSSRALHSHQGHHHGHHNHLGHHLATCVACWADQNNAAKAALVNSSLSAANGNGLVNSSAATTSTPLANVGGATLPPPASGTSVVRTRSAVSRKLDLASRSVGNLVKTDSVMDFDAVNNLADFSSSSASPSLRYAQRLSDSSSFISASLSRSGFAESSSDKHSPASLQHNHEHFRPPRPPPGAASPSSGHSRSGGIVRNPSNTSPSGGVGVLTRAAASASAAASLTATNCFTGFFDGGASSTASSTTSTPSTPTRRHNRRTRLPPVKISSTGLEVDDILRKIQKDSKNMNLDNHQINMAVQREIRLRNRIINSPPVVAFGGPPVAIRTPSISAKDRLGNTATAASTTTLSDGASIEGSVDAPSAATKSSVDLRV